METLAAGD